MRGASPSRSLAEGSFHARGSPSRSLAEGSFHARGSPSRSLAEGSWPQPKPFQHGVGRHTSDIALAREVRHALSH